MSNFDEQIWDNNACLTGIYQVDVPFMRNIDRVLALSVAKMSETSDVAVAHKS